MGVHLVQVLGIEQRVRNDAVARLECPAVIGHQPVNHRQADHFFQALEVAKDQSTVGPGAGQGHIKMIAAWFGLESALSARARAAVGGHPVAEFGRAADEVALVALGVVPLVDPFAFY